MLRCASFCRGSAPLRRRHDQPSRAAGSSKPCFVSDRQDWSVERVEFMILRCYCVHGMFMSTPTDAFLGLNPADCFTKPTARTNSHS